jgi:hypothetical protein
MELYPRGAIAPNPERPHGDDDLAAGVASFQVPDGLGGLTQGIRSVDDWA